jgi:hypothetical protein
MPGALPGKSQKMYSTQQELNDNWTKVSYKRGRSKRIKKEAKESEHWLNQTSTTNRYRALLEEESKAQQQKAKATRGREHISCRKEC